MTKFASQTAKINKLKQLCIDYQMRLYKEFQKTDAPFESLKTYDIDDLTAPIDSIHYLPKSLEFRWNKSDNTEESDLAKIAEKYNTVQKLRSILYTEEASIDAFKDALKDKKIVDVINKHRDGSFTLFVKNIFFVLSTFALGSGLALSYAYKNGIAFWKSNGRILTDSLQDVVDAKVVASVA